MSYIAVSKLWLKDPSASESSKWQKIPDDWLQGISQKSEEDSWFLPDGRQKWLRWEAHPWYLDANRIGGSLIFCEDVTKRKEIQIRADHLTKINDELENFAYMCPHDLQTHIRTLSSFVTLMQEHNHNKMDGLTRNYISYIKLEE